MHSSRQVLFDLPSQADTTGPASSPTLGVPARMRAVVLPRYGSADVLRLEERDVSAPAPGQVLVRVKAASVNSADWRVMRADPWLVRLMMGLTKPRSDRLGADFAGIVVAVGEGVEHLKADDEVFGDVSSQGFGSYAEYLLAEAESVVVKPVSLTFEQAAAVPMAASTALEGVRDVAQIAAGQRVLVNGASGGVGSFAVQLAKHYGAEVHAVCHSQKTDMVERLGAGRVIAYDKEDVTRGDTHYDVILDAAACRSFRAYRRILNPSGVYVLVGGAMMPLLEVATVGRIVSLFSKQRFRNYLSMPKREKLMSVKELIEAGEIEPAVDRTFALDQVPDALRYFESRQVRGKVVISV